MPNLLADFIGPAVEAQTHDVDQLSGPLRDASADLGRSVRERREALGITRRSWLTAAA